MPINKCPHCGRDVFYTEASVVKNRLKCAWCGAKLKFQLVLCDSNEKAYRRKRINVQEESKIDHLS